MSKINIAPKISVIVPVYKAEAYLHRCVDSILSQTYTNFELLLINDGSPDLSGEICNEYAEKDARVRVFHKKNGGVSSARNFGIENSIGEWICFIDSDDYVGPNYLQDFEVGDNIFIMPIQGFGIQKKSFFIKHVIPLGITSQSELFYNAEILNILNSPCYKLFNKSIIHKYQIFYDSNTCYGEDHIFVLNYLQHIKTIVFHNSYSYTYNQTTEYSLTRRNVPRKYILYYIETIVPLLQSISVKFSLNEKDRLTIVNKRLYRHWIKIIFSFLREKELLKHELSSTICRLKSITFSTVGLKMKNKVILSVLYYAPIIFIYYILKIMQKFK